MNTAPKSKPISLDPAQKLRKEVLTVREKSKKSPSDVKKKSSKFTASVHTYVKQLQETGAIPKLDTSPRDNDLVQSFLKVAACDPSVTTITIDEDPRFAHMPRSLLLDFGGGLRLNSFLTDLFITNVDLDNAFLSALAASLADNLTLQRIDLRHNTFTSDGLVDFCVALGKNCSVTHINLRHQHQPIQSQQEDEVLEALDKNKYLQKLKVEFRSKKCQQRLDKILERNQANQKTLKNRETKILDLLERELVSSKAAFELRAKGVQEAPRTIDENEYKHFFILSQLAKQYKVDLTKRDDADDDKSKAAMEGMPNFLAAKSTLGKSLGKSITANMRADGSFLTYNFISEYLVKDDKTKSLTFEFTNQFKLFKRFAPDDSARSTIVTKFVDALVTHPRSDSINTLSMANTCIGDDFVMCLAKRCRKENKLPNLHQINLETNCLQCDGIVALAKCVAKANVWKYLLTVKLDNQRALIRTEAEMALADAFSVNRTVIRFSMRVRNLAERDRINKAIVRNIDYLRQSRVLEAKKSGKTVKRARNKIELLVDKIAANDPSVGFEVKIVGDLVFLALNSDEKLKAAQCLANNNHITNVKMSMLKLDDAFAFVLAKSIEKNKTIEKLDLDANCIGSDGAIAIIGSLAQNTSITELQIRQQSKPMSTTDEERITSLLDSNQLIVKLGVDLRSQRVRSDIDRLLRRNQDIRRKSRSSVKKSANPISSSAPVTSSSTSKIKSDETEILLKRVANNDADVTEVILKGDKEFIQMPGFQKNDFYEGLHKNSHVKTLLLDNVELNNEFADILASILKSNKTIETISVNQNHFTSPGVLSIGRAASAAKKVRSLSILKPRFRITNEDADMLLKDMEKRSYLHHLVIQFREEEFSERLEKVLKKRQARG